MYAEFLSAADRYEVQTTQVFNRLRPCAVRPKEKGNCPTNYKAWAAARIRFQESIGARGLGRRPARRPRADRRARARAAAGRVATIDRLGAPMIPPSERGVRSLEALGGEAPLELVRAHLAWAHGPLGGGARA